MQNVGMDEAQAEIKIAGRNINNLRYANETTLMAESKEKLKNLLMKVKEESKKTGLKFNIQKTKIMASSHICSVQFSRSVMSDSLLPHESQHARPPCPSPTPGVRPNPCPLCRWCHPAISSSAVPFFSCPQSFLILSVSGSFQMSQLFASGGQSMGVSTSASIIPMNIHDWFPLGLTGLISFLSRGLSRVFSNTTIWKHEFFSSQPSFWFNSHSHTWLLEKP